MSFSRIVTLNSACWCSLHNGYCLPLEFFFSNITSFSYFLDRQNPVFFFPFSNSQFLPNRYPSNLCSPIRPWLLGSNTLSAHISALFGCWFTISSDFLWKSARKSALNPKIWAENRVNFNKVGDVSDPETEEQMLVMCAWVCASVSWPHDVMNI